MYDSSNKKNNEHIILIVLMSRGKSRILHRIVLDLQSYLLLLEISEFKNENLNYGFTFLIANLKNILIQNN